MILVGLCHPDRKLTLILSSDFCLTYGCDCGSGYQRALKVEYEPLFNQHCACLVPDSYYLMQMGFLITSHRRAKQTEATKFKQLSAVLAWDNVRFIGK